MYKNNPRIREYQYEKIKNLWNNSLIRQGSYFDETSIYMCNMSNPENLNLASVVCDGVKKGDNIEFKPLGFIHPPDLSMSSSLSKYIVPSEDHTKNLIHFIIKNTKVMP